MREATVDEFDLSTWEGEGGAPPPPQDDGDYTNAVIAVLLALILLLVLASPAPGQACPSDLVARWNKFAADANTYVAGLNQGVVDVRLRKRVVEEWQAVTRSECW